MNPSVIATLEQVVQQWARIIQLLGQYRAQLNEVDPAFDWEGPAAEAAANRIAQTKAAVNHLADLAGATTRQIGQAKSEAHLLLAQQLAGS